VRHLLLYLSHSGDPHRSAVGPVLAAAAERVGWGFECYFARLGRGRHFGGGDPEAARPGWPEGGLVAGGRHMDHLAWLGAAYRLVALGDPTSPLWPALETLGAEALARSLDPAELFRSAFDRLGQRVPTTVLVLDAGPQGRRGLRVAPYLYPSFLAGEAVMGVDVSIGAEGRSRLEELGAGSFRGLYVERSRAAGFPGGLDFTDGAVGGEGYASLTSKLAHRHRAWGRGVLLGDPDLVAAQLPKARRLRLLPLYGRPQTEVIARARELVRGAREPVYGRQYDDRDFLALAEHGHGLQIVDPAPPFDAGADVPRPRGRLEGRSENEEPDDDQLARWAEEGRVLATVLFWSGMIREVDCLPRLVDLAATLQLRAGLVLTTEVVRHTADPLLSLLASPRDRGGVGGLLEPLLAGTGYGVAAEALLPPGVLEDRLRVARAEMETLLPEGLPLRGWWALLDTSLVPVRTSRVGWREGRPVFRFRPRGPGSVSTRAVGEEVGGRDLRARAGNVIRRWNLDRFLDPLRPFEDARPGPFEERIGRAVAAAGFSYQWTKAGFGRPRVAFRDGTLVALPFTAGNWDGWTPFYTLGHPADVVLAERRLLGSGRPGWLAGTIDSPLWAFSGEVLEHGSRMYRIAELIARGGRSGRLLNVTPNTIARYARLLEEGQG
jgi:hypothetical protein